MIDDLRFHLAHQAFLGHMQANAPKGEPFTSFEHPFLLVNEFRRMLSWPMKLHSSITSRANCGNGADLAHLLDQIVSKGSGCDE